MTRDQDSSSKMAGTTSAVTLLLIPRHVHIPDIGVDNNVVFEMMSLVYSVTVLCLQYINLYKTVWWLPHSNANYAVNFYLINFDLFVMLIIIMSRRFWYSCFQELREYKSSLNGFYWLLHLLGLGLTSYIVYIFLCCSYKVVLQHSIIYCLFLCYPLLTYFILFRLDLKPLFGKLSIHQPLSSTTGSINSSSSSSDKGGDLSGGSVRYRGGSRDVPAHICSTSPEGVRDEVELLKTDFNGRIKQILFDSMLCAYYMGCVPLCFAQNVLYYDMWFVAQHVCLVWLSSFVLYAVHYLPAKYLNVFHRCSQHLGRWVHVESRYAHVPYTAWSELQVWPQGSLVKHVKGLFRAEGHHNSAEPGNAMHSRFYFMFQQPLRVINGLLFVTCVLVSGQFLLLVQATEWSHILSLAFLLFSNYYSLFKLARDRFILNRSYKDELALTG